MFATLHELPPHSLIIFSEQPAFGSRRCALGSPLRYRIEDVWQSCNPSAHSHSLCCCYCYKISFPPASSTRPILQVCVFLSCMCRDILHFVVRLSAPCTPCSTFCSTWLVETYVVPNLCPSSMPAVIPPSLLLYPSAWCPLTVVHVSLPARCLLVYI